MLPIYLYIGKSNFCIKKRRSEADVGLLSSSIYTDF